jgi:predicted nucleic acid-binding protein
MARFGWQYAGIVSKLKKHPADVQTLTDFRQSVETIPQFGVQVLPIENSLVLQALAISQQTGLLHNDSLIVAVMRFHGLTNLASVDTDFDRVPGITRYAPA